MSTTRGGTGPRQLRRLSPRTRHSSGIRAEPAQKDEAPACMRCRGLARIDQRNSPIAPASWAAGAIGDPRAHLSATGPGHPPEARLPGPPAPASVLSPEPQGCPCGPRRPPPNSPRGYPHEALRVPPRSLRGCPQGPQSPLRAPKFPSALPAAAPSGIEVALNSFGARSETPGIAFGPPGVSSGSPEVSSEWYPFSLVGKLYSPSGIAHKRIRRTFP
jgi:hypothetical protein